MNEINSAITELLVRSQGIDISKYEETFLNKSLQKRVAETHCDSVKAYFRFLQQNDTEVKHLLDSLHNSYSEFFRNPLTFALLEQMILPSIILKKGRTKRKEIRIWSAACAAGQEVYSLAILLEELKAGDSNNFTYRIFATDQSESQINEARNGQYSEQAIGNLNLKRVKKWFTKQGETFTVKPELKENIDFSVFDLFDEQLSSPPASIFGDFDLIVCANLLFYYKPEYQKIILHKTSFGLSKEGFLVSGETEREILLNHQYKEVFLQSAIFHSSQ